MSAGRKSPVVLLKWKRPVDTRQAIWDAIRGVPVGDGFAPFSILGLADALKLHPKTIESYVDCLIAGGFVQRAEDLFQLVRDVGIHAPRLRADGSPVTQGAGRTAAWRGMRVMKEFTIRELHIATGAHESDIKSFCVYLVKAGYLKMKVVGKGGKPSIFRMIRDTGPRAPQVTRIKFVFDPNLNAVTWPTAETVVTTSVEGKS